MQTLVSLFKEMCSFSLYKPTQGKVARRCTFGGLVLLFGFGAYAFYATKLFNTMNINIVVSIILAFIGFWFSFRLVNFPVFTDFLISVEAEMTKVSWPTRAELFLTTKIVLIFMFLFIAVICVYDNLLIYVLAIINKGLNGIF